MFGVIKKSVCLVLLSLVTVSAQAAGIAVSQSLDKTEIPYEGQAKFEVILTWDGPQSAYLFTQPLSPDFTHLKVQQYSSSVKSTGSGEDEVTTKTYSFTLKPTQSGTGMIDPVTISYLTWPDSVAGQLVTEPMSIQIAAAVPVQPEGKPHGLLLLILLGVLVIIAIASWIIRSRISKRAPSEVIKTPAEIFLENLAQLRLDSGNDVKKFQTGLYKQLVLFLKNRFGIEPSGQAAENVVAALQTTNMTDAQKEKISNWLIRAEKEKFIPVAAAPGETIRLESEVREFFEKNMMNT